MVQTVLVLARRDLLDVVAGMTIYLAVLALFVISIWRPPGVIMRLAVISAKRQEWRWR